MRKILDKYLDDMLVFSGCLVVLVGLSRWNTVITLVVAGMMLISLGLLVGRVRL